MESCTQFDKVCGQLQEAVRPFLHNLDLFCKAAAMAWFPVTLVMGLSVYMSNKYR